MIRRYRIDSPFKETLTLDSGVDIGLNYIIPLIVGSLPRADKRPSVGATSITQSAQLLTHLKFEASTFHLYYTTTMPSEAYCASEKRIKEAIEALSEGVYPSVRKCAKEMGLNQKTLNNRWNGKTSKTTRESINKRLTTAQERAIRDYIIRMNKKNMSFDETELAEFEKNTAKPPKQVEEQEEEKGTEELNSDEDLPDSNIIKYSYLNMTRPANISEVSYISPFRPGAELERRFQYQFNPPPPPTRRVEVPLPPIVYGHEYTEAEARDMLWRMNHPWVDEVDLTGL